MSSQSSNGGGVRIDLARFKKKKNTDNGPPSLTSDLSKENVKERMDKKRISVHEWKDDNWDEEEANENRTSQTTNENRADETRKDGHFVESTTEGMTLRKKGTPLISAWQEQQYKEFIAKTVVGSRLVISLAANATPCRGKAKEFHASLIGCHKGTAKKPPSFTVQIQNNSSENDDDTVEERTFSFPEDGDVLSAISFSQLPGMPPFNWSSRTLLTTPDWGIYYDGAGQGAGQRSGPSAAAVVVVYLKTDARFELSVFHPSSTNNCCEHAAQIAAFRISNHLPGSVAIIGDSKLAQDQIQGKSKCRQAHLIPLRDIGAQLWGDHERDRVSLHHMDGHGVVPNLADAACKNAQNKCEGTQQSGKPVVLISVEGRNITIPAEIFPRIPEVVNLKASAKKSFTFQPIIDADRVATEPISELKIKCIDDFLRLRAFPARSEVPNEIRPQWADIQARALDKVLSSSTNDERNEAMFDLLSLPNRWLPANVATRRIIDHFRADTPFNIPKQVKSQVQKSKTQRLSELITRKVKDHDIRGAVSILKAESEGERQMTQDEKIEALKTKFPQELKTPLQKSIPDFALASFSPLLTRKVLEKMAKKASNAIDGWSRSLILTACLDREDLFSQWGILLSQLLRSQFDPAVMECIRAARLVAVPKPDGGVRPIAVSHFFLKFAGACALRHSGNGSNLSSWQYAIGIKNGAQVVAHKLRAAKNANKVITKFDCVNAYGNLSKALVERQLTNPSKRLDEFIQSYFRAVYYEPSTMAVYGPSGRIDTIKMVEGSRQGDATSSFNYCLGQDLILEEINNALFELGIIFDMLAFMDDLSLVTDNAKDAAIAAKIVIATFAKYGLTISLKSAKSASFVPKDDAYWNSPEIQQMFNDLSFTVIDTTKQFVVMGGDLSDDPLAFFNSQWCKQERYFAALKSIDVHPAITHVIMRFSGVPRLRYLCSIMPPSTYMQLLCKRFDSACFEVLNGRNFASGRIPADHPFIYEKSGIGLVKYSDIHNELYEESKHKALTNFRNSTHQHHKGPEPNPHFSAPSDNVDASSNWIFYCNSVNDLTPSEYITALLLRMHILPIEVRYPIQCSCGSLVACDSEFIDHCLLCDYFTRHGHKARHDEVTRCLLATLRQYSFSFTSEPSFYTYIEENSAKGSDAVPVKVVKFKRPDATVWSRIPVAFDTNVLFPNDVPGHAADKGAAHKILMHRKAVQLKGHVFFPLAMEIYGILQTDCFSLINHLKHDLPPHRWYPFRRDCIHSISVALARGRGQAVLSACLIRSSV